MYKNEIFYFQSKDKISQQNQNQMKTKFSTFDGKQNFAFQLGIILKNLCCLIFFPYCIYFCNKVKSTIEQFRKN